MSLVYAAVAVDGTLVCEYSLQGNAFKAETVKLLQTHKAPVGGGANALHKATFASGTGEKHLFNVLTRGNVAYLAVCENVPKHQALAFRYLDKVHNTFMAKNVFDDLKAIKSFNSALKAEMEYYNSAEADKITKLQNEIEDVKQVMHQNLDKIIERGERVETLVEKTEDLAVHSQDFFDNSRTLRKKMFWKNVRIVLGIFFLVSLIIFIFVVFACGGFTFKDCKSKKTAPANPDDMQSGGSSQ